MYEWMIYGFQIQNEKKKPKRIFIKTVQCNRNPFETAIDFKKESHQFIHFC